MINRIFFISDTLFEPGKNLLKEDPLTIEQTEFSEGNRNTLSQQMYHEIAKTETNCASCHLDIHELTVGDDCARCHDSKSWLVNNIEEIHRRIAFPLLGAHATADCSGCHKSESALRFDPLDTECISCHQADFASTVNPDHTKAGFSTNCIECHRVDAFEWTADGINHDFFPLTDGHDIQECAKCHTGSDYSKTSPECITCHEADYLATTNPVSVIYLTMLIFP